MGIYWDLFFVFFKIGLFSFGGGLAMVSVIQQEVLAHGGFRLRNMRVLSPFHR